jgi:hypothetical protein
MRNNLNGLNGFELLVLVIIAILLILTVFSALIWVICWAFGIAFSMKYVLGVIALAWLIRIVLSKG